MSVAHVLNTALKKHLLYENYAYKPTLISVIEHSYVCTYCVTL